MNYFTLFDIPIQFKIDKKLLSKKLYELQLKFHPDLFVHASEHEKKIILEKSIEINKGYKILKDSLSRTIYLLSLCGIKLNENTIMLKNNSFLTKYFSLYEDLEKLKEKNFNKEQVNIFLKNIERKIQIYKKTIEIAFTNKEHEKIIQIVSKLLFFKKIKVNLKKEQDIFKKKN